MYTKLLCLNPVATESAGEKPKGTHNMCPNNLSCIKKWGGYYASFVAILCSLHSVADK